MRFCTAVLISAFFLLAPPGHSQSSASGDQALRLVQTVSLPANIRGGFDHFGVDIKRGRLFLAAEDAHAVLVIDIRSGKLLTRITDVVRPHAVFYRPDLDRIYVTDGGDGSVKIYDAEAYHLLKRIALEKDADSIGYDISRKYLYIDNGGKDIGKTYSMFSGIDTTSAAKISEMKVEGDTLEAMALDNYRPHIYVNDKATNQVVVIDRLKNRVLAKWPLTLGSQNVAMALDEQRQRLFIGCRSGQIVVLDSNTGRQLQTLPIGKGIDDLIYDPRSRRIYAAANGQIDVYEQADLDHYVSLGSVPSSPSARTERLVPEWNRLFVAAPAQGSLSARVLVYEPIHLPPVEAAAPEVQEPVVAPVAERLVLTMLSEHPLLRRMGLHVIPPGQHTMILIANGNATRLGIHTSPGDFAAVASGKTYGPLIPDGQFYNMKMPMFDAQGRHIGILVMEIPHTWASSEVDAAHKAEAIRAELEKRIPSLQFLFSHPAKS